MGNDSQYVDAHESYGSITFTRTGYSERLFGSSLKHQCGAIAITIERAQLRSTDYSAKPYLVAGGGHIVTVLLSRTQLLEALLSSNTSSLTPCTLQRVADKQMKRVPESVDSQAETLREDALYALHAVRGRHGDAVRAFEDYLSKSKISKKDQAALRTLLSTATAAGDALADLVQEEYRRETERAAAEAKDHVDAMITSAIDRLGTAAATALGIDNASVDEDQKITNPLREDDDEDEGCPCCGYSKP